MSEVPLYMAAVPVPITISLSIDKGLSLQKVSLTRKVDGRIPGKENSNSHGARPVHLIITMIKWIRTSRLSIKNSLSLCWYYYSRCLTRAGRTWGEEEEKKTEGTRCPGVLPAATVRLAPHSRGAGAGFSVQCSVSSVLVFSV